MKKQPVKIIPDLTVKPKPDLTVTPNGQPTPPTSFLNLKKDGYTPVDCKLAGVKLRHYQPSDSLDVIFEIHLRSMKTVYPELDFSHDGFSSDLKNIQQEILGKKGVFLVAEYEGKPVGFGSYVRVDDSTVEIMRMRTDPDYGGKGIGKSIVLELERIARERGYTRSILDTTTRQEAAIGLYTKLGYTKTGKRKFIPFEYGDELQEGRGVYLIYFEKNLD